MQKYVKRKMGIYEITNGKMLYGMNIFDEI